MMASNKISGAAGSAFPPHRSLPSQPVSTATALAHLQAYLEASTTNACLLPNATLQLTGPVGNSDSSSNLVIHNLKRVEAGLKGEFLAPVLELDGEDPFAEGVPIAGDVANDVHNEGEDEGWQELDEYQREQSDVEGEVGHRHQAVAQVGDEEMADPEVQVADDEEMNDAEVQEVKKERKIEKALGKESKPVDKEARKRDKRNRIKAERREKAHKSKNS